MFDLKVAHIHSHTHTAQTSMPSDNKGRLKLSAREPTDVRTTDADKQAAMSDAICSLIECKMDQSDIVYEH